MATYDHPIVSGLYGKRRDIAEVAEVSRLERLKYLDMIDTFATRFGKDPDVVFWENSFGTVTNFLVSWKEKSEFNDRYSEHERNITQ